MRFEQPPENIIEDSLERKKLEPEEELKSEKELGPDEDDNELKSSESRRSNVIEGPWPKREIEPEETPEVPKELEPIKDSEKLTPDEQKVEPSIEQTAELEKARQGLEEVYKQEEDKKLEKSTPEKSGDGGEGGSEKKTYSSSETYTEYRRCERCNGWKYVWFFKICPVCKGFGRLPVKTTTSHSVYTKEESKTKI